MKINMKKLLLLLPLLLIIQSCGYQNPIIGGEKPFIVDKIEKYNNTHSKYLTNNEAAGHFSKIFERTPMIILPSGLYQIGDTIIWRHGNEK